MNEYLDQAINKLNQNGSLGAKERVMHHAVRRTLTDFCKQDAEFAQAVAQGGSFADCMKKVAEGVGGSISDIDAYTKAVQFYFPGAKIRVQMSIDLIGEAAKGGPSRLPAATALPDAGRAKSASEGLILDFTQFL